MLEREGELTGTGGVRLHRRAWLPEGAPRGLVVVAHGAAEHGGRYRNLAARLVPDGFAVHVLDHRGHGRSEGRRAYLERLDDVVADFDGMIDAAAGEHPGVPVFVLGHSMGGCVALVHALRHQERLRGLVISSPVAVVEAPLPVRLAVMGLAAVVPRAGVRKVDSSAISRDPDEVRAYDSDPLVYRGKLPARTVAELVRATDAFPAALPRLTVPLLVIQGTADRVVDPRGARLVHDRAGSSDKTLHTYEGYFHELFNEPARERERPLDDVARWLAERT